MKSLRPREHDAPREVPLTDVRIHIVPLVNGSSPPGTHFRTCNLCEAMCGLRLATSGRYMLILGANPTASNGNRKESA